MNTRMVKGNSGSRRTPATTVSASPNTGIHDSKSDHLPYLRYHRDDRSNDLSFSGNQRRPRKRSMPRPRNQLTTLPSVLPMLATARSSVQENLPLNARPTST